MVLTNQNSWIVGNQLPHMVQGAEAALRQLDPWIGFAILFAVQP